MRIDCESSIASNASLSYIINSFFFPHKTHTNPHKIIQSWHTSAGELKETVVFRYCVACQKECFTDYEWDHLAVSEYDGQGHHCDRCMGVVLSFIKSFRYDSVPSRASVWSRFVNERRRPV